MNDPAVLPGVRYGGEWIVAHQLYPEQLAALTRAVGRAQATLTEAEKDDAVRAGVGGGILTMLGAHYAEVIAILMGREEEWVISNFDLLATLDFIDLVGQLNADLEAILGAVALVPN